MREIKFRAWDENRKKLEFFDLRDLYWRGEDTGDYGFPNNTDILMQYTEFKDKNKKEVYFFDILRHNENKLIIINSVNLGIVAVAINKNLGNILNDGMVMTNHNYREFSWLYRVSKHCEVIGNIHENPELLRT